MDAQKTRESPALGLETGLGALVYQLRTQDLEAPLNLSGFAPSPGTAILPEPTDDKLNVFACQDWRIWLPRPKALRVLA
jgi:hypothetical protein